MTPPQLLALQIAEDKGLPMQQRRSLRAIEGVGLEGDRYATSKGAFSGVREVVRHISLIEEEALERVKLTVPDLEFSDTRRNLLTRGVHLNDLVGEKFRIGTVQVEGVELCDPCDRPGILSPKQGLKDFKQLFELKGGLRVKILESGLLRVGDLITLETSSIAKCPPETGAPWDLGPPESEISRQQLRECFDTPGLVISYIDRDEFVRYRDQADTLRRALSFGGISIMSYLDAEGERKIVFFYSGSVNVLDMENFNRLRLNCFRRL